MSATKPDMKVAAPRGAAPAASQVAHAPNSDDEAAEAGKQIEVLVRARYPLLYVITWEEERAMAELSRVAAALGKQIYHWTIVQGLCVYRGSVASIPEGRKGTKDPLVALRDI